MLILAIDTSHKNGSVCLARGDEHSFELIETAMVDGGTFSAQLVPVISKLLRSHGLTKSDIQGITAAVGPGSFTGLRIGLSAVKGLAEVLQVPIAAVSMLEAVAASGSGHANEEVLAVMDAGRSEFYVGRYRSNEGRLTMLAETLFTREEFAAELRNWNQKPRVITPEQNAAEIARVEGAPYQVVPRPGSEMVAQLGLRNFANKKTTTIDELDANYVRRDASLFTAK